VICHDDSSHEIRPKIGTPGGFVIFSLQGEIIVIAMIHDWDGHRSLRSTSIFFIKKKAWADIFVSTYHTFILSKQPFFFLPYLAPSTFFYLF